jgi:hypothetical protein
LLRNLRDALKGTADRHHAAAQAAAREVATNPPGEQPPPHRTDSGSESTPALPPPSEEIEQQPAGSTRREATYEQVLELHRQGLSRRSIASRLGLDRGTVRRFLEAGSFPERAGRRYSRRTDRFAGYLKRRWAEGCHNAAQLFAEIKAQGFNGSYYAVRRQLACWRKAGSPTVPGPVAGSGRPSAIERPSARRVSWLLLKEEVELEPEEKDFLERLQERCPELRAAAVLGRRFAKMVQQRREDSWDEWVSQATAAEAAKELRSFAEGLQKDEAAARGVALGVEQWPGGRPGEPVEDHQATDVREGEVRPAAAARGA